MQQLLDSPLVVASRHLDRPAIFDGVRTAAVGWDGREPIRRAWPS
jgi:hypothetical protein